MEKLIAHVKEEAGKWIIHDLKDHLEGVCSLATQFAETFSNEDWIKAASLLHDLGKSSADFQNYIKRNSGYDLDAHIENIKGKVTHSTHGAVWAYKEWGEQVGKIIAYLIAGHHGGLPDWNHEMGVGGKYKPKIMNFYGG